MTYIINKVIKLSKDLLILYKSDLNYKSIEPKFLQREPFIEIFFIKYLETD